MWVMSVLTRSVSFGLVEGEKGVFRCGGLEKLVVDIKLEQVPLDQTHVPLCPPAVELDPLETDVLLGQRGGEEGEGLGQPAVQALSSVVRSNDKFLHGASRSLPQY